MNKEIMRKAGFGDHVEKFENGICPFCNKKIGKFKDAISEKEYKISGLCQECQDDFFND